MNINDMMSLALVFMLPCGDLDIECINIETVSFPLFSCMSQD